MNIPCCSLVTKPIKIELPIVGIINDHLNNTVTPYDQQILIPFSIIDQLIKENISTEYKTIYYNNQIKDYVLSKEEATEVISYQPYLPSAYIIKVDSIDHVIEVANQLKNKGYTIQSDYFEYEMIGQSIIHTKETLQFYSSFVVIIIFVLLCIKQFFKKDSQRILNIWLKNIGINNDKSLLIIKLKKYSIDFCLSFFISCLLLFIMIIFTFPLTGNDYDFQIMMFIVLGIIHFMIYIVIPFIWEVFYDRN